MSFAMCCSRSFAGDAVAKRLTMLSVITRDINVDNFQVLKMGGTESIVQCRQCYQSRGDKSPSTQCQCHHFELNVD